jgi:hypothetical protein
VNIKTPTLNGRWNQIDYDAFGILNRPYQARCFANFDYVTIHNNKEYDRHSKFWFLIEGSTGSTCAEEADIDGFIDKHIVKPAF